MFQVRLNLKSKISSRQRLGRLGLVLVIALGGSGLALADQFDTQIQQLNASISASQGQVNTLRQQSDTLANQIAILNAQINSISSQIQLNSTKIAQVQSEIADAETQLVAKKAVLAENIKAVYQRGTISPIEMLASSDNLSDFVNQEQYLQAVKDRVSEAMAEVVAIKAGLEKQRTDLTALLATQRGQQTQLQSTKADQANLLAQTQGQEASYQAMVADNKKKLAGIYAERARLDALNHVGVITGGTGGYPWSSPVSFTTESDPWGFYLRQCVSYVAWKRRAVGRAPYPYLWGNAYQWAAYANSSSPSPGAIAVFPIGVGGAGDVGHVAYVESVNGDGTMNISEFNWHPYQYDERTHVPTRGVKFVQ